MMQHKTIEGQEIEISARAIAKRERAICDSAKRESRFAAIRPAHDHLPWFVLRTMTGCEQAVENVLRENAIESLVPMRKGKTWERRGRKIEGRPMPVIHGYVLVRFMPDPVAFEVVSTIDKALGFLRMKEQPKPLSHLEVKRFYQRAMAGDYDWKANAPSFHRGEKVRIVDGPFEGHPATVVTGEARKGDVGKYAADLIVVAVMVFGVETPVTLPLAMLEKL